jgi:predicted dehydrogenase
MGNSRADRTVRIGIVGCGNVMDGAYMPEIEKLRLYKNAAELAFACHTSRTRCQHILDKWNVPSFTTDYRELCHSDAVDLVLVLTSMQQHGPIAKEALSAGKHVLVEKPMAATLEDADELLELAKKSPGYLVCAPFVILSATYQTIWNRVRRGDIGKVSLARARYGWSGPDWAEWFYRPGSGCIFDLGVYSITSLTGLLGPVRRVMAMTGTAQPERMVSGEPIRVEVEDNAQILLDFGGSVFAVVSTGFTMQKYRSPALELYGTRGTIQMLGDDWAPEGYEVWLNDAGAWQYFYESDPHWMWTDGLRHLVECIRQGVPPVLNPEHAYHTLEIMLAAQASGRDGLAKEITSAFPPPDLAGGIHEHEAAHRIHDPRRSS